MLLLWSFKQDSQKSKKYFFNKSFAVRTSKMTLFKNGYLLIFLFFPAVRMIKQGSKHEHRNVHVEITITIFF